MPAPTDDTQWGTGGSAEIAEPTTGEKQTGWIHGKKGPAHWFNWWMRAVHRWLDYYGEKDAPDGIVGLDANEKAVVAAASGAGTGFALTVSTSGTNGKAISATGNGTGAGIESTGGASSGTGVKGTGGASNGLGVEGVGDGTGSGVKGTGGDSSGAGIEGVGGSTNGIGVKGVGAGTGAGVQGTGPSGGNAAGVKAVGTDGGFSVETSSGTARFNNEVEIINSSGRGVDADGTVNTTSYAHLLNNSGTGGTLHIDGNGSPGRGPLHIDPTAQPSNGEIGDLYVDTNGVLFICTTAGTPGTWTKVGTQT